MKNLNIKHIFIAIIVVAILTFFNMCNSCTAKKNTAKLIAKTNTIEQMDSTIIANQMQQIEILNKINAKQITGEDVMQLYLNTAVNSPRTLEQIAKDSVLSKMIKK